MAWHVCSSVSVRIEASQEVVPFFAKKSSDLFQAVSVSAIHVYPHRARGVDIDKARDHFSAGDIYNVAGHLYIRSIRRIFPAETKIVFR